ncbi:MAG: serine hydrolase [candidate division Zixibacteria bacterium]|nr:serine hydrolase [candidate division Zixibacteria bacterium]
MKIKSSTRLILALITVFIPWASFAFAQQQGQSNVQAHIENIENGLLPPILVKGDPGWNIYERMDTHGVPGVSIAVIDNFAIAWAKGYGVKDVLTNEPVTVNTMFQAASISKPLNATAIMKRVQDGMLSLDADVNDYLHSWKIPDNEFTATNKVTLANLLSHTGGTTLRSPQSYAVGEAVPTIQQILRGEFPASNSPVTVDMEPGRNFSYSSGGTIISQLVLMELENKPYPQIMEELVLAPLEMTNSTFAQPLPSVLKDRAAAGHSGGQRIEGKFLIHPDLAAGGLWSTPSDLARFAVEHQLSALGRSNKILTQKMEEKMMTPYISDEYGLGFAIHGDYFEHFGGTRGFTSLLFGHKTAGYGAIIMINFDNFALVLEILRAIAREYQWEDYLPEPFEIVSIAPEKLTRYAGRYLIEDDNVVNVREDSGRLYAERAGRTPSEIFPISDSEFISKQEPTRFLFTEGPDADHDTLCIVSRGDNKVGPRIGEDKMVPYEYLMAGELDKAIESYKAIQRADSSNYSVSYERIYGLGEALWFKRKYEEAIALLIVNTELYPNSENAFRELAVAYLQIGNKELAIESYERLLELDPRNRSVAEKLRKLREDK